jgi:uncharacterized protein YlzI (FlbEa/FlbD family)
VIGLRTLDGSTMYLNEDLVERVEGGTTTAVHLANGNYFVVRDDVEAVSARIRAEKQAVLAGALALAFGETSPSSVVALARSATSRSVAP